MRSTLLAGMSAALLLGCGCQSTNWTAKNKKEVEPAVAQNKPVREIPWSEWRKKKGQSDDKSQLPAELQAKLDKANGNGDAAKTAAEWVAEGNQLEVGRNFAAATKAYESALQVDPVNADAHHRLGIMADMRQEYGTARDHYEAALRQKPHDANLLSDFGYSMHLQGKAQQSERYLLQSLDIDPQHKQALKNLVTLYASQDRYEDASQVCRRLRPEAEAQRLLDQGFPKGRSIPENESVELASNPNARDNRTAAMPTDVVDPALKHKSVEEMYQLMAQERQAGIHARQQKSLKEFRPEIQESLTQEDWEHSQKPDVSPKSSQPAWAQNSPPDNDFQPIIRPGRSTAVPQQPKAEQHAANTAGSRPFPDDVALWNGAPLKPKAASSAAATDNALAANDDRNEFPPRGREASLNPPTVRDAGSTGTQGNLLAQSSANLRAYQLGMSAGPGTMFPVLPVDAGGSWRTERTVALPAVEQQPANIGSFSPSSGPPQWSSETSPRGYTETRLMSPPENAGDASHAGRWPSPSENIAPRSPTDHWESPSTMPWPERAEMKPQPEIPRRRTDMPPMPRVSPGSTNSPINEYDSAPASFQSGAAREAARRPDVVPAWFDSPREDRPGTQPTSDANAIQQWPYAPQ